MRAAAFTMEELHLVDMDGADWPRRSSARRRQEEVHGVDAE